MTNKLPNYSGGHAGADIHHSLEKTLVRSIKTSNPYEIFNKTFSKQYFFFFDIKIICKMYGRKKPLKNSWKTVCEAKTPVNCLFICQFKCKHLIYFCACNTINKKRNTKKVYFGREYWKTKFEKSPLQNSKTQNMRKVFIVLFKNLQGFNINISIVIQLYVNFVIEAPAERWRFKLTPMLAFYSI